MRSEEYKRGFADGYEQALADVEARTRHNPDRVARLEEERARKTSPAPWAPAPKTAIAELVRAVTETDREGRPRKRRPPG